MLRTYGGVADLLCRWHRQPAATPPDVYVSRSTAGFESAATPRLGSHQPCSEAGGRGSSSKDQVLPQAARTRRPLG
jgi:hypothetical protein